MGTQQLGRGWGPCAGSHLSGSVSFTPGREGVAPLSHLAGRAVGRSELSVSCSPQGRDCACGGRDAALPAAVCRGQRRALDYFLGQLGAGHAVLPGWMLSGPGVNQTPFLGLVGLMEPRTFSTSTSPMAPLSEALQGPCPPAAGWLPPCPA